MYYDAEGRLELARQHQQALRAEIAAEVDPAQLVFETNALLVAANLACPLFNDPRILEQARVGIHERLRTAA